MGLGMGTRRAKVDGVIIEWKAQLRQGWTGGRFMGRRKSDERRVAIMDEDREKNGRWGKDKNGIEIEDQTKQLVSTRVEGKVISSEQTNQTLTYRILNCDSLIDRIIVEYGIRIERFN